jgi:hypothetical protein
MAGDDGELVGDTPVGDRDAGGGGHTDRTGDAGHHGHRDACLGEGDQLLHAPAEDIGVAALEPDHELPGLGVVDQGGVDGLLRHEATVGDLGRVDDLDLRAQLVQEFARGEAVGDDDVGLGEQAAAANGDQVRVAGAAADERDAGGAAPATLT